VVAEGVVAKPLPLHAARNGTKRLKDSR